MGFLQKTRSDLLGLFFSKKNLKIVLKNKNHMNEENIMELFSKDKGKKKTQF
jgi:uncharacterized protein YneF (UPF0154 family)